MQQWRCHAMATPHDVFHTGCMSFPDDLLRRGAEDAVRLIALDIVARARSAAPCILAPADDEGLHDFRVAIRRLRSTLSSWKGLLHGVAHKRDRQRLAGFQKRTGASRDAEVALEWLADQVEALAPKHRSGCKRVEARLRSTLQTRSGAANREVCNEFTEWADDFVSRMTRETSARGAGPPYAQVLAERVDRLVHGLEACVDGLGGDRKQGPHRLRIACKRLRYLIAPVKAANELAASVVRRCKQLQHVLGALNDANVLDELLQGCLDSEGETRGSGCGVIALSRLNAARADAAYRLFRIDWLENRGLRLLLDEAAALAHQLRKREDPRAKRR